MALWLQVILISCARSAIIVHHVREEKRSVAENLLQLRFWVVVLVELHQELLGQSALIMLWTSGQDCSDGRQDSIRMRLLGWRPHRRRRRRLRRWRRRGAGRGSRLNMKTIARICVARLPTLISMTLVENVIGHVVVVRAACSITTTTARPSAANWLRWPFLVKHDD